MSSKEIFEASFKVAVVFLLAVIAVTLVVGVTELVDYLNAGRSAWTAPWINVINRGPVQ